MVDWKRVSELRSRGADWDEIARDPKVAFHTEASVTDPGRALRALYQRERAREARHGALPTARKPPTAEAERRWTLLRAGYFVVPVVAVWFVLAFVAPSPVGLMVPAIPDLGIALAGVALFLIYALWRSQGHRWSAVLRSSVIVGVIVGLLFAGLVGVVGSLVLGCPYLPPASALHSEPAPGWTGGDLGAWTEAGKPVLYMYGATWCPYCSASSWAIWKALTEFGTLSGATTGSSSPSDIYPQTPEIVLAGVQYSSDSVAFQVSEDTGGVAGVTPPTSGCYQLAYVSAYRSGIPFMLVVDGKYIHAGATMVSAAGLANWSKGQNGGATFVKGSVQNETGAPWSAVQAQAWWLMAMLAKSSGQSISVLANATTPHWSAATRNAVANDLAQL